MAEGGFDFMAGMEPAAPAEDAAPAEAEPAAALGGFDFGAPAEAAPAEPAAGGFDFSAPADAAPPADEAPVWALADLFCKTLAAPQAPPYSMARQIAAAPSPPVLQDRTER